MTEKEMRQFIKDYVMAGHLQVRTRRRPELAGQKYLFMANA